MSVARGVLLAASVAVTATFFFSHWAVNAGPLGRYDAGMALAFAFLAAYAVYASLALAAVALAFAAIAALARRGSRLDLAAPAVALMPIGYLLALDLRQLLR